MTELMWIRSHTELLLQAEWDLCRVTQDPEGDYPFRRGTAMGWVSVLDSSPPMVRVWAHAAYGVKPTLAMLREINELQSSCLSAKIHHQGGIVLVSQTISPVALTQPVLAQALDEVGGVAAHIGPLFAAMFNGATPLPVEKPMDEEVT